MKKALILAFGLMAFSSQAFAIRDGDGTPASIRQANRSTASNNITIQGALTCDMGGANDGAPCTLRFQDQSSGRVYTLTGKPEFTNAAMRLYHSGSKNVALQGRIAGGSFEVTQVPNQN